MQLTEIQRPRLELSGPKLRLAFESLLARAEEQGGVEAYVEALKQKSALFRNALEGTLDIPALRTLCAYMATVRRRVGPYLAADKFSVVRESIAALLEGRANTATTDARMAAFCATFPGDREHRWVRDLAAELLHNVDSERYPLMQRWVWDVRTNTGVLREIWHGEDVDNKRIDVPDGYAAYLMLREELTQYLAANGVFRDVPWYVDVLTAQVYADYIGERGGTYLRAEFATPEDPMLHTRRILGLEGADPAGRSRLKAADGVAEIVPGH